MPVKAVTDSSFSRDVLESSKPVLVDFWAEWCAPCRMMGPVIDRIAATYADSLDVVKVDVDHNPLTVEEYGVKSIPRLAVFVNGRLDKSMDGAVSTAALLRALQPYL